MKRLILCISLLLGALITFSQQVTLSEAAIADFDALINKRMKEKGIVGLSYAIVDRDGLVFSKGHGYAKKSEKLPATAQTAYGAGSISKVMTATAIMKLHQEGKLDIDDDITQYVPEFKMKSIYPKQDYSIRAFLIHKSGISADYIRGVIGPNPMSLDDLVLALNDEYQAAPSNKIHVYTNLGYDMLGVVIERVSGMSYEAFMQQEVLEPLGMGHSSFLIDHPNVRDRMSKGYTKKGEEWDYVKTREVPAGGLLTTVEDLGKFAQMMLNKGKTDKGRFYQPETVAAMWTQQNKGIDLDFSFAQGLGWKLSDVARVDLTEVAPIRWHSGSTSLFCAMMLLFPEQGFAVLVLENTQRKCGTIKKIANHMALAVLDETFDIQEEPEPVAAKIKRPAQQDLENMPGHYATQFGWLKIWRKGKQLRGSLIGKKFRMVPYEDGQFGISYLLTGMIPIKIGSLADIRWKYEKVDGEAVLVFAQGKDEFYFGHKFKPEAPGSEVWANRLGDYELMNLGDDIRILYDMQLKQEGDLYYLQFIPKLYEKFPLQMPLRTHDPSLAFIRGYGRYLGDAVKFFDTAEGTIMYYMGYKWRLKE